MSEATPKTFVYTDPKELFSKEGPGQTFFARCGDTHSWVRVNYPPKAVRKKPIKKADKAQPDEHGRNADERAVLHLQISDRLEALLAAFQKLLDRIPESSNESQGMLSRVLSEVVSKKIKRSALDPFIRVSNSKDTTKGERNLYHDRNFSPPSIEAYGPAAQEDPRNYETFTALGQWHVGCWIDEDMELGPLPRFLAILAVLRDADSFGWLGTLETHWAYERAPMLSTTERLLYLLKVFPSKSNEGIRDPDAYLVISYITAGMMTALNELRIKAALPGLRFDQIPLTPVGALHKRSLSDFKDWLRHGLWRCTHSADLLFGKESLSKHALVPQEPAKSLAEIVRNSLLADEAQRPVVMLHSLERPSLLRASAALALQKESDVKVPTAQKWCVVALRVNDARDRDFEWTVRQFLVPLSKALNVPLWSPARPASAERVETCLELLRQGLARTRCIIIIDGLQTAGTSRYAALFDFLSGASQVQDLIRSLALPWFGQSKSGIVRPEGVAGVTRILVLCNQPSASLLPLAHQCIDADALFRATVPSELAAAIGATRVAIPGPKIDPTGTSAEEQMQALVRQLLAHPRGTPSESTEHVHWLLLLAFIAAVPDGLFVLSLQRLFEMWWQLVIANPTFHDPSSKDLYDRMHRAISDLSSDPSEATAKAPSTAGDSIASAQARRAPADFTEHQDGFVQRMRQILSVDVEQVTEGLSARHLQWEVGTLQSDRTQKRATNNEAHDRGVYRRRISFSNLLARDLFIDAFRALSEDGAKPRYGLPIVGERAWKMLQFAAAGECLRQSTSLLRNSTPAELRSLGRHRRMIQCISHVAAAGDMAGIVLPGAGDDSFDHQRLLLPLQFGPRLWFSYVVLYARVVERKVWRLSKNWGQSELRTGLLLSLILAGHEPRAVIRGAPRSVLEQSLVLSVPVDGSGDIEESSALLAAADPGIAALGDRIVKHLLSAQNRLTRASIATANRARAVLNNLAHSAIDAEDRWLAVMACQLIQKLSEHPFVGLVSSEPAPIEGRARLEGAHLNLEVLLRLDLQSTPNIQLEKTAFDVAEIGGHTDSDAMAICLRYLQSFQDGKYYEAIEAAVGATRDELLRATRGQTFQPRSIKAAIDAHLLSLVGSLDASLLSGLVAMLLRLASARASKADRERDDLVVSNPASAIGEMAFAWATFHVADVLRGAVGHLGSLGPEGTLTYGMVSSRSWRAGIRATLALARMLAKCPSDAMRSSDSKNEMTRTADFLFEYARSRADILVRDTYQSDRERVFATLLQCGVVRAIACSAFDQKPKGSGEGTGLKADDPLTDAVEYVVSAERRLLALGAPPVILRRHLVERIATLGALFSRLSAGPASDVVESMLRQDLLILQGLTRGSEFFRLLHEHHNRRFSKSLEQRGERSSHRAAA